MILITGNDPIVDRVCTTLESLGHAYCRVDDLDTNHAWELGAKTVMVVEPLSRLAAAAPVSERGLREVISVANVPGVRTAIVVTPRPDTDPELRAIRRSGIPYTILRPLPIVERASESVLVAREIAGAAAAAVTADMIVDAIVGALAGNACGQTLDVAPPPEMTWSELFARAGVTPKPVAGWRARVGRWFGAHTFDASMAS